MTSIRSLQTLIVLAAALGAAAPAQGKRPLVRTAQVDRAAGSPAGGDSLRPMISDGGRFVVFDSKAANRTLDPDGSVRDVFVRDLETNLVSLVSIAPDSATADGPSTAGAISETGLIVVFASEATNLVSNDGNAKRDVFASVPTLPPVLVSAGLDGLPSNGSSAEADVSADGRRVVFSSTGSNLVAGDNNRVSDVFVRDLVTGTTRRVSQTQAGRGGNGPSSAPAISPDGRYVSFYSEADNLTPNDGLDVPDVYLADLKTGRIQRVSVSSRGRPQNDAVEPPFVQISDVSTGGRAVVFDSDATNLVPDDRRGHTDIFLRDVGRHTTARVSVAGTTEANSDSVYPRISPSGRFVTFESFANNLFPVDATGPDSFLYDRRLKATTILDVRNSGRPRAVQHDRQLLQRPSVSADGNVATFTSAASLVAQDDNGRSDAYVRRTDPAKARIRVKKGRYRVTVDDPRAEFLFCRFLALAGPCHKTGPVTNLPPGKYKLTVRAFGPGIRLGPVASVRFRR